MGVVNGSFDTFVLAEDITRYQSHKGWIAQNILATCCFNMLFCYLLTEWEGSVADGHIFDDAYCKGLAIPPGQYYLGDAGFSVCDSFLVSYNSIKWKTYSLFLYSLISHELNLFLLCRPKNAKKLINLHHAHLCNIIK